MNTPSFAPALRGSPARPGHGAGVAVLFFSVALLVALAVALQVWVVVAAVLALGVGGAMVAVGMRPVSANLLLWLLAGGFVAQVVNHASTQLAHLPVGYVMELFMFTLLPGALIQAKAASRHDPALRWVGWLFLLFMACGVASSVLGRSHTVAALWQLQYNLKWPAMFLLGLLIHWDARFDLTLKRLLALAWVPILAFVVLEVAAKGAHQTLFGPPPDYQINPLLGSIRRLRGPFQHSGYLALISGCLAWLAAVYAVQLKAWRWAGVALIYTLLLLASGQRQETMGFVLALALGAALLMRRHWILMILVTVLLVAGTACLAWALDYAPLTDVLHQWGVGSRLSALSERAVLSEAGLAIANRYWPLGSGLGTYGGVGAQKFDLSQFVEMGFQRYWWFRENKFLVDVYWPSVVAESGWPGAAALAACYAVMMVTLVRRLVRSQPLDTLLLMGSGVMLVMLSNTPSSVVITDPRGCFALWLIIGAAWRHALPPTISASPVAPPAGASSTQPATS